MSHKHFAPTAEVCAYIINYNVGQSAITMCHIPLGRTSPEHKICMSSLTVSKLSKPNHECGQDTSPGDSPSCIARSM